MQSISKLVSFSVVCAALVACGSDVDVPAPTHVATSSASSTGAVDAGAATGSGVDEVEVVNGVPDRGRDPAVVAIDIAGEALCSGTLINPQIVMTARHCVSVTDEQVDCSAPGPQIHSNRAASSLSILLGEDIGSATVVAKGKSLVVPPGDELCNADIALIILDRAVTSVTPVGFSTTAVKVGEHVRAVGFGMSSDNSGAGVKLLREHVPVQSVGAEEFQVGEATCQGDSGGPALDEATSKVIGVVSRGGPTCVGTDVHNIYTRVDAFVPLLEAALREVGGSSASGGDSSGTKGAPKAPSGSKPASDVGATCTKGADCATGICVDSGTTKYCSRTCGSGDRCPDGYHCTAMKDSSEVCISTAK